MTKPTPWTKAFETSCRKWQVTLGLTDWTIHFKVEKSSENNEAEVSYNCTNRHATITSYICSGDLLKAERVALHEMLHLLLADVLDIAGQRGCAHDDAIRAEHCVIERLLNAMDGRP